MAIDYNRRRRQELERMNQQAQYEQEQQLRRREDYYADTWTRPNNTLGPNEDVVEKRRIRKRVHVVTGNTRTQNILGENIVLLIGLIISIIILYNICIYILNQ